MNAQNGGGKQSLGLLFIVSFVLTLVVAGYLSLHPSSSSSTLFIVIGTIIANFLSFMQVYPRIKSHVSAVRLTGVSAVFLCLFLLSLALNVFMLTRVVPTSLFSWGANNQKSSSQKLPILSHPSSTPSIPTVTLPTASVTPSPTPRPDDSASSLIPVGQSPTINDPLGNNNGGYDWDTGENSEGTGSCDFEGHYYLLTSPAGPNNGVGCNPNTSKGIFSNFVYQIKMTILTGVEPDGEAGPTFRVNPDGSGQQYQASFDAEGDWAVTSDKGDLKGGLCANPCSYFHKGVNQANYITIRVVGSSITVQINGHDLGSFTDSSYTSGYIGVEMSPGASSKGAVAFSNLRVWQL